MGWVLGVLPAEVSSVIFRSITVGSFAYGPHFPEVFRQNNPFVIGPTQGRHPLDSMIPLLFPSPGLFLVLENSVLAGPKTYLSTEF